MPEAERPDAGTAGVPPRAGGRALRLLCAAVLVGGLGAVAQTSMARPLGGAAFPDDAIAVVNGTVIRRAEYEGALALMVADKRDPLTDADRDVALTRLIEEELLVQAGVANGLLRADRRVRQTLVQAMLASITAESVSAQPAEDVLRAYYTENEWPITAAFLGMNLDEVEMRQIPPVPFDTVRDMLEEEYQRQARDGALAEYLQWLRADAEVVTVDIDDS